MGYDAERAEADSWDDSAVDAQHERRLRMATATYKSLIMGNWLPEIDIPMKGEDPRLCTCSSCTRQGVHLVHEPIKQKSLADWTAIAKAQRQAHNEGRPHNRAV